MNIKLNTMRQLVDTLNKYNEYYYDRNVELVSNKEYDELYQKLEQLEVETGIILSNSPTQHAGYETSASLPKKQHVKPMLSLNKTKSESDLETFLGDRTGLLSWKLDGLTVVLTYRNGDLVEAVTRGDGITGEVITANAKTFTNIPLHIPYNDELIVRGEALITYSEFERINNTITVDKYKNPRNLCSGTVRQLNSKVTAQRNVRMIMFELVKADGVNFENSHAKQFEFLQSQGFETVEYKTVTSGNVKQNVQAFRDAIVNYDVPSDGLVLLLNDIAEGERMGVTAKYPKNAIAFKWCDETVETKLVGVDWSVSRTGAVNPVAVFEPVEIDGTTVTRASLHNLSIMKSLQLGIGDTVTVYKANMIIPQIDDNLTRSNTLKPITVCPDCGGTLIVKTDGIAKVLYCTNRDCKKQTVKNFAHYASKSAMNITGLSEKTIGLLLDNNIIHSIVDLYHLDARKDEIVQINGLGLKRYKNIIESVEKSRDVSVANFINALSIQGVGLQNAKAVANFFNNDIDAVMQADVATLESIDGVGHVLAVAIIQHFNTHGVLMQQLLNEVHLQSGNDNTSDKLDGLTFVVTGPLEHFDNRNALQSFIESNGGKLVGSVSGKVDYLINNDVTSTSSKNVKARQLGVKIISEKEFIDKFAKEK